MDFLTKNLSKAQNITGSLNDCDVRAVYEEERYTFKWGLQNEQGFKQRSRNE